MDKHNLMINRQILLTSMSLEFNRRTNVRTSIISTIIGCGLKPAPKIYD